MKQPSKTACERIQPWLSAYADGQLNKRQTAAVRAHVCGCPSCARELEEIGKVTALLRECVDFAEPSPRIHASVMQAVNGMPRALLKQSSRYTVLRRVSGALACVGCLVVIGAAVLMGGVTNKSFDAMSPEAESPMYNGADGGADAEDQVTQEPSVAPMEPDLPTQDVTVRATYVLDRMSGTDGVLDGEWEGDGLTLSLSPETDEVKVCFEGENVRSGTYKRSGSELTLRFDDGGRMSFDYRIEEGRLWLMRK